MNQIIVRIPRKKQKVKIIKSGEIIRREFDKKIQELSAKYLVEKQILAMPPEPEVIEEPIVEIEQEIPKPKRTFFSETFTISDSNQPIEINLSNIPEESITIDEAAKQIQLAYDKGIADGHDSARALFESEARLHSEWIKRFDKIAFNLKKEFIKEISKFEDSIVELSALIAERIVEEKIDLSNDVVITQIKKSFKEIGDEEIFQISLNENDYDVLNAVGSNLLSEITDGKNIPIVKSHIIEKGGCILNTSAGTIDARISGQLSRLKESLSIASDRRKIVREASISDEYPEILDTILPNVQDSHFPEIGIEDLNQIIPDEGQEEGII